MYFVGTKPTGELTVLARTHLPTVLLDQWWLHCPLDCFIPIDGNFNLLPGRRVTSLHSSELVEGLETGRIVDVVGLERDSEEVRVGDDLAANRRAAETRHLSVHQIHVEIRQLHHVAVRIGMAPTFHTSPRSQLKQPATTRRVCSARVAASLSDVAPFCDWIQVVRFSFFAFDLSNKKV